MSSTGDFDAFDDILGNKAISLVTFVEPHTIVRLLYHIGIIISRMLDSIGDQVTVNLIQLTKGRSPETQHHARLVVEQINSLDHILRGSIKHIGNERVLHSILLA